MMELCIFHSVNSGLYCWDGETGLLIDGVYDGRTHGLSEMPDSLVKQMTQSQGLFAHIDGILFTHQHPDHFQRTGLSQLMHVPQPPLLYGPGLEESNLTVCKSGTGFWPARIGGASVWGRATVHDGKPFCATPHCSYLLQMGQHVILIAGDAALGIEDAAVFSSVCGGIDMVFLNVYQLLAPMGPRILEQLRPKRIFLIHLPFVKDDTYHYWVFAKQCMKRYEAHIPQIEILPHMSWIDGKTPSWDAANEHGACALNL